jgi:hypothetical protein
MIFSLKKINSSFLISSLVLLIFCGFELFVMEKIYPFAFIGTMGILSFSSFLAISFLDTYFHHKFVRYTLIAGVTNSILLFSFSFYPNLLHNLWNISIGLGFLFPTLFVLHLVYPKTTPIEKTIYFTTLFTATLFELTIFFKLSIGWIYDLLSASLLLETLLLLTLMIIRLNRRLNKD